MRRKSKVLFVCVHNAARSQMAETYLNDLGEEYFQAESAGFEPATVNPLAIKAMEEEGYDISGNTSDSVFDFFKKGHIYQFVITVCDESQAQRCPLFPGITQRIHWSFTDPSTLEGSEEEKLEQTRKIRDEIKAKINEFIEANRPE